RRPGEGGLRPRLFALPPAARAALPARRDALRRRAADGRDGTGADVQAQADADGRAVDGPRAGAGRAQLRDHQGGPRSRSRDPRRRAERERVAVDREPGVRPLDGPAGAGGQGRGSPRGRGPAEGVPRPLETDPEGVCPYYWTVAVASSKVGAGIRGEF